MTPWRVSGGVLATALALATMPAMAKGRIAIPLPPPRPADLGGSAVPAPEPPAAELPGDPCLARLTALGVAFHPLPPQGSGACRVEAPVSVTGLPGAVLLSPAATVVCPLAETLARWSSEIVAPAALTHLGGPVKRLEIGGSYECRGRNRQVGALLSEHAIANAADIMAFATAKTVVRVATARPDTAEGRFVAEIRAAACGRFGTVLGPGSDPFHSDHLHLDGKARRTGYCR